MRREADRVGPAADSETGVERHEAPGRGFCFVQPPELHKRRRKPSLQNAETWVQLRRPSAAVHGLLVSVEQEIAKPDDPLRNVVHGVDRAEADRALGPIDRARESVSSLIANPPPEAPVPPILPPVDGFLFLDKAKFVEAFAEDVRPDEASFMAASQVPWALPALEGKVTVPAWKTKPSWYLVATADKMIPPDAQRLMSKRRLERRRGEGQSRDLCVAA